MANSYVGVTLCGLTRDDALPRMIAYFVNDHREARERTGTPFVLCRVCEDAAISQGIPFGKPSKG